MDTSKNVPTGPPVDDEEFERLLEDLIDNPEKMLSDDIDHETLMKVQRRLNPYGTIGGPPQSDDHRTVIACSYTNLREDYLRRLAMTSLVGFVYQMQHEWEVPEEKRRWVPPKKVLDSAASAPFDPRRLAEQLEATAAIAREAVAAADAAAELTRQVNEAQLTSLDSASTSALEAQIIEATNAEAKAVALLYAATHGSHALGMEAGNRIHATYAAGAKYPEVKAILSRQQPPPPPGTVEMPMAFAKDIIKNFLDSYFKFDPAFHVRSGHNAERIASSVSEIPIAGTPIRVDMADPSHITYEALVSTPINAKPEHQEAVRVATLSKANHSAVVAILRDSELATAARTALSAPQEFMHYLYPVAKNDPSRTAADNVPPQDTFHRWNYYTEVNYETLRTITEVLYPERSDLDWALGVWKVFEGTSAEVDKAFDEHCQRYSEEFPSAIKAIDVGGWSLLADFKQNREKATFFNKNTEVLKRILDRHADDKRIGAELMRNRVRQVKAKNIREDGPDAAGLKQYKATVAEGGQDIRMKGAERVISAEEMRRLELSRGNVKAAQELELLEQYEKTIKHLTDLKSRGTKLTAEEERDLLAAEQNIERAREMAAVPDDAIQVDVFKYDAGKGTFDREIRYTKAEEALLAEENKTKTAPARARLEDDNVEQTPLPNFAPFAVEHILKVQAEERAASSN